MKKNLKIENAPNKIAMAIENSEKIEDFLQPPEALIRKEETTKVTIALSKNSIDFFKKNAKKTGVSYQVMIKRVLDLYSTYYNK